MYDLAWESLSVQVKKLLKFYSNAGPEVKSSRGCAGICQLDPTSCDIFVYETINQICYLGKIEGSYSFLGKQPDAAGFLEVGTKILGVTWFMISYFLYDVHTFLFFLLWFSYDFLDLPVFFMIFL